jgi:hypothetical protein
MMIPRARTSLGPAIAFVILGTVNAIMEKVLYEQEAAGLPEYGLHKFVKPFFFATMLFFGVSLSIVGYLFLSYWNQDSYPRLSILPLPRFVTFSLPGFFGLFQGAMSSITAALIGVSVDYMMRSATLIGVSLIAKFFFKKEFQKYEWAGMIIVALSLTLVGLASVLNAENSITVLVSRKWTIVILILKALSQAAYSIKLSIEQYYTQQFRIPPMVVSGLESLWGFAIGAIVLLPVVHNIPGVEGRGIHEDAFDTFAQLQNNGCILLILSTSVMLECVYSVSSVSLTEATSAVARTLIESFRTFLIWIVQLALFYGLSRSESLSKYKGIGEEWATGSWVQLAGYIMLICGLLTYRGTLFFKPRKDKTADTYGLIRNPVFAV